MRLRRPAPRPRVRRPRQLKQRLLADAVERILSEPFTVRELVILSPYRAGRSAVGVALSSGAADARLSSRLAPSVAGTGIEDSTRIRWGTIHEFTGLEAPAVILTDIDLSKEHHRDLLYVGASRATDRLVVLTASVGMNLDTTLGPR